MSGSALIVCVRKQGFAGIGLLVAQSIAITRSLLVKRACRVLETKALFAKRVGLELTSCALCVPNAPLETNVCSCGLASLASLSILQTKKTRLSARKARPILQTSLSSKLGEETYLHYNFCCCCHPPLHSSLYIQQSPIT